jgi:hypothetical protein
MELWSMDPVTRHFDYAVLIENVEHHISWGRRTVVPKVRDGLGRRSFWRSGNRWKRRPSAPRKPTQPSALKKAMDAILA